MSLESTTKSKRPRVILPSQPNEKTGHAGEKKENQASKTTDMRKLEKQLCNCYSLEYSQVSKFEVSPFTALLNMLKCTYEATPEIFRTVVALLLEYNPHPKVDNRQMTARCLRVLLDKNPDLADCLISMLPEQLSTQQAFSNPLAALPTKVKPEQWKGAVQSRLPHEKEQSPAAKYYNYSTPAVTAFIATQGIPSKVTSNEGQLFQPTLLQPVMGPANNLMAIKKANPRSKAPVLLCGPYNMSSSAPYGEPASLPPTRKNMVSLVPTKQPGVWSSSLPIGVSVNTPPQSTVSVGSKQVLGLPLHVPSIVTTTNAGSVTSSVPFEPESIRTRAKRKLAMTESLKLNQTVEEQSVDVKNTSSADIRSSQQFPYDQEIVFKDSSHNPVNVEYAEGNYLACLAQMVERLPPIPIPEADIVEDMGSSDMNIPMIGKRTSKGVFKVETRSDAVATGLEMLPMEGPGAEAGLPEWLKSSNSMVKSGKVPEEEDENQHVDLMECSSMKKEIFQGDDGEDTNSMSLIDVDNVSECTSQSLGNSQVSCMSNEDGDGLHLVVDDMDTKREIMDKSEQDCSSSQGSCLVVDG